MALDQKSDPELKLLIEYLESETLSPDLNKGRRIVAESNNYFLDNNILYHVKQSRCRKPRNGENLVKQLAIPKNKIDEILQEAHNNSGHFSSDYLFMKLSMWCFWPKMFEHIRRFCSNCHECQICKGGLPPPKPPFQSTEIPNEIFSTWMFDILKLSITPRQNQYLLVIICKYSHWTILIYRRLTNQLQQSLSKFSKHCICEFGVMKILSSDRAAAFMGKVFKNLTDKFGIKHIVSSSQHAQSQGLVERANRVILSALRCLPESNQKWDLYIASVSLALKSTPSKALSGYTSFEIVTGCKCRGS